MPPVQLSARLDACQLCQKVLESNSIFAPLFREPSDGNVVSNLKAKVKPAQVLIRAVCRAQSEAAAFINGTPFWLSALGGTQSWRRDRPRSFAQTTTVPLRLLPLLNPSSREARETLRADHRGKTHELARQNLRVETAVTVSPHSRKQYDEAHELCPRPTEMWIVKTHLFSRQAFPPATTGGSWNRRPETKALKPRQLP